MSVRAENVDFEICPLVSTYCPDPPDPPDPPATIVATEPSPIYVPIKITVAAPPDPP